MVRVLGILDTELSITQKLLSNNQIIKSKKIYFSNEYNLI